MDLAIVSAIDVFIIFVLNIIIFLCILGLVALAEKIIK
jgi:hypothetical protein